jgi:hypothetical protein
VSSMSFITVFAGLSFIGKRDAASLNNRWITQQTCTTLGSCFVGNRAIFGPWLLRYRLFLSTNIIGILIYIVNASSTLRPGVTLHRHAASPAHCCIILYYLKQEVVEIQ